MGETTSATVTTARAYFAARWRVIIQTAARDSGASVNEQFIEALVCALQDEIQNAERYGVEKLRRVIDAAAVVGALTHIEADIAEHERQYKQNPGHEGWYSQLWYVRGKRLGFRLAETYFAPVLTAFR